MHNHFENSCRFEGPEEHQRPFSAPYLNPYQPENLGIFRQAGHNPFNRNNYPLPEIAINIGEEPQCAPGAYINIPGNPRFYDRNERWGNNYNYRSPYIFNGGYYYSGNQNIDGGFNYDGNPNAEGGYNYGGNSNADGGYNYGGNQNPEGGYNQAPDAPANVTPTNNQDSGQVATPGGTADAVDYSSKINWIANHVPLGTADSATYLTSPAIDSTNTTDQATSVAPIDRTNTTDQATRVAPIDSTNTTDQATSVAPIDSTNTTDQATSLAPIDSTNTTDQATSVAPIDRTNTTDQATSLAPIDSTNTTVQATSSAPIESTNSVTSPDTAEAPPAPGDTLDIPSIYSVPDMTNDASNAGNKN